MPTGLRDRITALAPSWLRSGVGERFLYMVGLGQDALLDKMSAGIKARMPGIGDFSALALIAADRLIPRGISESDESFAGRLTRAFFGWQIAGSSRSVLSEVRGYLLAFTPAARVVSNASMWFSYSETADISKEPLFTDGAANWTWDTLHPLAVRYAQMWWRMWLVLDASSPQNWTDVSTWAWGDAGVAWGDTGYSWGLSCSPGVVGSIRSIVALRKGAHAWYRWIIVSFDPTLFDPNQPAGGGVNPDGNFGRWSKIVNGQYVPARFANARYCDGVI